MSRLTVVGSTPAVGESPLNVKLERVLFRFSTVSDFPVLVLSVEKLGR